MTHVKLRLQKQGVKNHHRWYIIAQAKSKHWDGNNHFERIGYWYPNKRRTVERSIVLNFHKIRYWLAHNAEPTKGVYRLLYYAGLLPKPPIPYGSKYTYKKPEKELKMKDFKEVRWGFAAFDIAPYKWKHQKIKRELRDADAYNFEFRKRAISNQVDNYINERLHELNFLVDNKNADKLKETGEIHIPEKMMKKSDKVIDTDCNTDELNSDEPDFELRIRNFHIVSKKLKNYFNDRYKLLRGKDLQYNTYIRKLEKLTRRNGINEKAYEEFSKLVTFERERNEVIFKRLTYRFKLDIEKSEEYKKDFFKYINKGKVSEEDYQKFIDKDVGEVLHLVNRKIERYILKLNKDPRKEMKEKEKEQNQELIEDFKILRLAKFFKKLKESYLHEEGKESDRNITQEYDSILSYSKSMKKSYMMAVDGLLTNKKFMEKAYEKINTEKGIDYFFFKNANESILQSERFKKLSKNILLSDLSKQKPNEEDIFYLNDDMIDSLCEDIQRTLNSNYDLNDLYDDKNKESYNITPERSKEIEKKILNMKEKYGGELNLLYDDIYSESPELKEELKELKNEYSYELIQNVKLEEKFKSVYTSLKHKFKESKSLRKKFAETYNKVIEDLQLEREGKKEVYKPELKTIDEDFYYLVRREIEMDKFGEVLTFYDADGMFFDPNFFAIDKKSVLYVKKYHRKKIPFSDKEKQILLANETKKKNNTTIEYNFKKSMNISGPTITFIMNRFVELFGNNSDIIYPEGFRHLENFELYKGTFPDRTPKDYQDECKLII